MAWKDSFAKGEELVLATASAEGVPHANVVESLGFFKGKLLVADCQMGATLENLRSTGRACLVGGYVRLKGSVEVFSSGEFFDYCVKETPEYEVRHAVVVTVEDVFDLDACEPLE